MTGKTRSQTVDVKEALREVLCESDVDTLSAGILDRLGQKIVGLVNVAVRDNDYENRNRGQPTCTGVSQAITSSLHSVFK